MEFLAARIHIPAPHAKVLAAITTTEGMRGWWALDCKLGERAGQEAVFHFDEREVVFRIDRIDQQGIELTCIRNVGQPDWQDTHLSLRAITNDGGTQVDLLHDGWRQKNDFYESCKKGWDFYLKSLRAFVAKDGGIPHGSDRHPARTNRTR